MGNILAILRRDFKRLIRVPSAWVITIGLIVIPCMYAWFNIYGFWNPYGNTSAIKVAIANEDKGADSSLMGEMNLGDQIVAKLKTNDELGWQFDDESTAMQCVESGECYAAIVIPSDFSSKVANILTDTSSKPTLEYYVNEKANAIAPRITEVGATTVDREVNSTFVSTVSGIVTDLLNKANTQIQTQTGTTVSTAVNTLTETKTKLEDARKTLEGLEGKLESIPGKTATARDALDHVQSAATDASGGLKTASDLLTKTQGAVNDFQAQAQQAFNTGGSLLTKAARNATSDVSAITSGVTTANGYVSGALGTLSTVNSTVDGILTDLKGIDLSSVSTSANTQLQSLISELESRNADAATSISDLKTLSSSIDKTATSLDGFMDTFNSATDKTVDDLDSASSTLADSALPQLNSGLSSLATAAGSLSGSAAGSTALISQTSAVLDQLDTVASSGTTALESTDTLLGRLVDKIDQLSTDLTALASSNTLATLLGNDGTLDTSAIAEFMMSPTVLKTTTLYPINSYGSGMAPLFTSLSLWVGVFMLMALFKLEVDDEGLQHRYVTAGQKYWARFLLLAPIAALQGILCSIGDLIIGVQCVNRPVFVLTAMLISLCYLSICYMLSTVFMHVGKALIIVFVMVMIPGASGLYPIEMLPKFFQELHPLFPFTYAIAAFRETIGGFYDGHWIKDILTLLLFAAIAFAMGLLLRPLLTNLIRLFAREAEESDMINSEKIYLPERRYSAAMALEALSDRGGYRKQIQGRAQRFAERYPKLLKGALIAGIIVPFALFIVFSVVNDGKKMVALAAWCIWLLIIIAFLMIVEYIRDSLSRQAELSTLNDDAIVGLLYKSNHARSVARDEREAKRQRRHHVRLAKRASKLADKRAKHTGKHGRHGEPEPDTRQIPAVRTDNAVPDDFTGHGNGHGNNGNNGSSHGNNGNGNNGNDHNGNDHNGKER
ncbi:YhgE/Pip domain-containing protein [Bifidobacterium choloepi]|uniref:YhgE/Pip domain-containing protein n=1 Tax=Bifidobacterium choloepi TaxID=2614131 RepID=A0A6I5NBJ9_9BIFI|nr:YhgE/Pip domain-containing protein [Bifidobacterium choloepi]NEG69870.1 YhgE/Pip domain-containing protein [Bifidobacterium choloepi]